MVIYYQNYISDKKNQGNAQRFFFDDFRNVKYILKFCYMIYLSQLLLHIPVLEFREICIQFIGASKYIF